ncbi:ArsR family transcriptional regulator [Halobacillus litoralis]|uniref:ArsR family transcriptional regulator n=1 Tax=Halobacillus litoralis TaxID=45668 RepID=UPI001CD7C0B6|nr:ArsR family transcriptional regulator [Halobacillus litoralis]MCA0972427.1 ArsR family transcriptional regulator [Halobacillus litoralis]
MNQSTEMVKALFDPKLNALMKSVEDDAKTVKEMAAHVNEKPSRLYYPIKKLMNLGLLQIEREEMVGNLKESYYTSRHLTDEDFSFEGEFAKENRDLLLTQSMMEFKRGLDVLKNDLESDPAPDHSSARMSHHRVHMTLKEWEDLHGEIRELIQKREKESTGQEAFAFNLLSFKDD